MPIVVYRRITLNGAELEDVRLMSQWDDEWDPEWNTENLMEAATKHIDLCWHALDEVFQYDEDCGDPLITNVHLLKLKGKEAKYFRVMIDVLENIDDVTLFDWLRRLPKLDMFSGESINSVQNLFQSIIKQVVLLNIPKVIPLGKSENNPN